MFCSFDGFVSGVSVQCCRHPKRCLASLFWRIVPLRTPDFDVVAIWKRTLLGFRVDRPRCFDAGCWWWGDFGWESQSFVEKERIESTTIANAADGAWWQRFYWIKQVDVENLVSVVDAFCWKTRVVVLAHVQRIKSHVSEIGLLYLDGAEHWGDKRFCMVSGSLVPVSLFLCQWWFWLFIAEGENKNQSDFYPLYRFGVEVDADGTVRTVKKTIYRGIKNYSIFIEKKAGGGDLIISGPVTTEKGNEAGWILKVMTDGNLVFNVPIHAGLMRLCVRLWDFVMVCGCNQWCYSAQRQSDKATWVIRTDSSVIRFGKKYDRGNTVIRQLILFNWMIYAFDDVVGCNADQFRRAKICPFGDIISGRSGFGRWILLEGSNAIPFRMIEK